LEKPLLEFPCDYPIKVIGRENSVFRETILEVVSRHDSGLDYSRVEERVSGKGNYLSVTIWITATGKPQLDAIFRDLKATGLVSVVL
jgi:putative lipoic acid-binding regulatory protein